jgi:hydroxyacylglutathione hydrolase
MYIEQIYTACLSQASYYIESDGIAAIVDPMRDIEGYIRLAEKRNARIKYVLNTHFHADFVSGHLELARATGAVIVFGPGARPEYKAVILEDKENLCFGKVKIAILHTPGHTIESVCYLLFDEKNQASVLFSGDTLFIGDVGRPDLLSGNLSKTELAAMLYDSISKKIKILPDNVLVYPGHGAGSACGKNLGKERWSTIGEQKKNNYAMGNLSKEEFIAFVCEGQPDIPGYFFRDAALNKKGYSDLDTILERSLKALSKDEMAVKIKEGVMIIDTRPSTVFGEEFLKGSVNIGLEGQFATWFGTLIDFDKPVVVVSEKGKEREVIIRLARIGYEKVAGYYHADFSDLGTDSIGTINIDDALVELSNVSKTFLDVRNQQEVIHSKVRHSIYIPLEKFGSELSSLRKDQLYLVYCAGGYRSMIAASIMKKNGFGSVYNIKGGINKINETMPIIIEQGILA